MLYAPCAPCNGLLPANRPVSQCDTDNVDAHHIRGCCPSRPKMFGVFFLRGTVTDMKGQVLLTPPILPRPPECLPYHARGRGWGVAAVFDMATTLSNKIYYPRTVYYFFFMACLLRCLASHDITSRHVTSLQVISRRSTEGLSLTLAVVSFVCSLLWLIYGVMVVNAFIYVPNVLGVFFSSVQVTRNSAVHKPAYTSRGYAPMVHRSLGVIFVG